MRAAGYDGIICAMSSHAKLGNIAKHNDLFNSWFQKPALRSELYQALGKTTQTQSSSVAPMPESNSQSKFKLSVILAEDNKTNQLVFKKMVKALDLDLRVVENGAECLAAFEESRPNLIFTDISMPEMDGMEATKRIRAIEKAKGLTSIPIIALTAHAIQADQDRFLAAGMDACLTKPLKKDLVIAEITKVAELLEQVQLAHA